MVYGDGSIGRFTQRTTVSGVVGLVAGTLAFAGRADAFAYSTSVGRG